jgi:signal transduction histidine kinase
MPVSLARRGTRATAGLALGGAMAFAESAYLAVAVPALAVPAARPRVLAGARALAEANRRRLARYLGSENATDYSGARAMRYLATRCVLGMLANGIFLLILWGAGSAVILLVELPTGAAPGGDGDDWSELPAIIAFGLLLLFLAVQGLIGVATLERLLAHHFLGPSEQELLRRRVSELATTRAGVVEAVNDERRRIERDLHDGVQQRLVALGMLLGRARRTSDPEHNADLLRQAHEESQRALHDLREVTWRVYPIALDDGGLPAALEAVAERSSVPVRLRYQLAERPDPATETVAYFVASEAVTNALKHGRPGAIDIEVAPGGAGIVVRVRDDGTGGARASGTGLSGLARRVAAVDGTFSVDSPPGGPTVIIARLPCG